MSRDGQGQTYVSSLRMPQESFTTVAWRQGGVQATHMAVYKTDVPESSRGAVAVILTGTQLRGVTAVPAGSAHTAVAKHGATVKTLHDNSAVCLPGAIQSSGPDTETGASQENLTMSVSTRRTTGTRRVLRSTGPRRRRLSCHLKQRSRISLTDHMNSARSHSHDQSRRPSVVSHASHAPHSEGLPHSRSQSEFSDAPTNVVTKKIDRGLMTLFNLDMDVNGVPKDIIRASMTQVTRLPTTRTRI